MGLEATTRVMLSISDSDSEGSAVITDALNLVAGVSFTDGTGAESANVQWNDLRTLAGASEDLDLAGGITNRKGKVVTATDVKAIAVRAPGTNAGNIVLRFNPTNGWNTPCTGDIVLPPGSFILLGTAGANGWAVTAGTADILRVMGASGYVYEIGILAEGSEA